MEEDKDFKTTDSKLVELQNNGDKEGKLYRFPTFADESIEKKVDCIITYNSFVDALERSHSSLNNLLEIFKLKLNQDKFLHTEMLNLRRPFPLIVLNLIYLSRHFDILRGLMTHKFREDKIKDYEFFITGLNNDLLKSQVPEAYLCDYLIPNYQTIYSNLADDVYSLLIEEVKLLFSFEKKLLDKESIDYKPSLSSEVLCLEFLYSLLRNIHHSITDYIKKNNEENAVTLIRDVVRIEVTAQFFHLMYFFPETDIFNQREGGEEWINLRKHYKQINNYSREAMQKQLQKVFDGVSLGYASVSKVYKDFNSNFMRKANTGLYMAYYFFNKKKALTESKKFLMKPEGVVSQTIWNMLDQKPLKTMIKVALPGIKFNKKYYLKRIVPIITLDTIVELTNIAKTFQPISFQAKLNNNNQNNTIKSELGPNFNELIKEKIDNETTNDDYVKIKVIHSSKFQNKPNQKNNTRNCIIVHIHGGGFIAMSPSSHQNYTRKWSNQLGVPVFSIDYRLSPQYRFPHALDDVYQAYVWLITYGEEYYKIQIDDIILAGDSAGGNLVASLTYLLIMNNIRLPKVVFMFYPALKMCLDNLSLSYLNAITDSILEFNLLTYCIESYQAFNNKGEAFETKNPFVSPLFMEENIIRLLPPVRIIGGSADPLRDDGIYFIQRLIKLNKEAKMTELKYFPHGFLNYDVNMLMTNAALANDIAMKAMDSYIVMKKE